MGGAYVIAKSNNPAPVMAGAAPSVPIAIEAPPRDRNAKLLEAMKEELFQLELDRQQGKISQPEYDKAKAALDETIRRAVARSSRQLAVASCQKDQSRNRTDYTDTCPNQNGRGDFLDCGGLWRASFARHDQLIPPHRQLRAISVSTRHVSGFLQQA